MKRLVAVLALLLSASIAQAASQNGRPRALMQDVAIGAGGSGTEWYLSGSQDVRNYANSTLAVLCTFADSVAADSAAFEAFLFADLALAAEDSSGLAPMTLDDSRPRLSGGFFTTLDSARLVLPGNLTPITGAASTQPKFPYDVSSRVVYGKGVQQASGVNIPGAVNLRFGQNAANRQRNRWFFLPLNDAYGGVVRGADRIAWGFLNRHPRIGFTISAWLLIATD